MLKPIKKRKSKSIGKGMNASKFNSASLFVANSQSNTQSLHKLNELSAFPQKDSHIHIVTKNAVNALDFILSTTVSEVINILYIAFYRIGAKAIDKILDLKSKGRIKKVVFLINDGMQKLVPKVFNKLEALKSSSLVLKVENTHTKIILMKTKSNYYVVSGSGNMSINARIEQYIFENRKSIFEFHKNWIDGIK